MQIIPVIDLKDGVVVHAVRGERSQYQAVHLHSKLTTSSDIDAVLTGFLQLYPFETFYIADLNAITGNGNHAQLIESLLNSHPQLCFWIDNGSQLADMKTSTAANYKTVIGTESQTGLPQATDRDYILSLDYKQQLALGHPAWFHESNFWPENIIAMTLNRVGGNAGPDIMKLGELIAAHPEKNFVAAGGVRHAEDLNRLAQMSVSAALLATALHQGLISADEIEKLRAKKYPGKPGYF